VGLYGKPVAGLRAHALYPQEKCRLKVHAWARTIKPFSADDISASHGRSPSDRNPVRLRPDSPGALRRGKDRPHRHTCAAYGQHFRRSIFKYSYREAVIDDDLIDHEAPVQITTALSKSGTRFAKDEEIEMIDPRTGKVDLARTPDEIRLRCDEFNKNVVTTLLPISNQECFPGLTRNATDARGTGCRQTFLRPGRTGLK